MDFIQTTNTNFLIEHYKGIAESHKLVCLLKSTKISLYRASLYPDRPSLIMPNHWIVIDTSFLQAHLQQRP